MWEWSRVQRQIVAGVVLVMLAVWAWRNEAQRRAFCGAGAGAGEGCAVGGEVIAEDNGGGVAAEED